MSIASNGFNGLRLLAIKMEIDAIKRSRGLNKGGAVQQYIDSECLRLCDQLIPYDEAKLYPDPGRLIRSGTESTNIGSGFVSWETPYARRWYYMPANFQGAPQRGNYWFERMKQQYRQSILDGAARIAGIK